MLFFYDILCLIYKNLFVKIPLWVIDFLVFLTFYQQFTKTLALLQHEYSVCYFTVFYIPMKYFQGCIFIASIFISTTIVIQILNTHWQNFNYDFFYSDICFIYQIFSSLVLCQHFLLFWLNPTFDGFIASNLYSLSGFHQITSGYLKTCSSLPH